MVTGGTGYVGGEVVAALLDQGWRVRVLSRSAGKVQRTSWGDAITDDDGAVDARAGQVEVVEGDASDPADLRRALDGVDVAWYLLHSMGEGTDFQQQEREMAQAFADAARAAAVSRIVYLGGLHPQGEELSEHLASRVEVGEILLGSGVPTAALQAGVVLGDESQSFVMLRHLAERLPGAIAPRWLRNTIQPIAADDVVHYLVAAADLPADVNRTFDVAGPDVISYADMMKRYAAVMGLGPRPVVTAPVTTPRLAARWIGLVTPVPYALAQPLIGSLLHDTVASECDLADLVGEPQGGATGFEAAVRRAAQGQDTRRWRHTVSATGLAVLATAAVGSLVTDPSSRWYRRLSKPSWQPPSWAFPVAWTALYADIALVSALTIADLAETDREEEARAYARALGLNLMLNAGWSAVFFGAKQLRPAAVEAVVLAASSADLVRRAAGVSPEKGVALAPYALWTAFAAALTAELARRNA
ncbi:DNA-binding protein [Arsenicicoccus sp. oral taxon 190]|nr:DNA-binding protein [Arsenicicoccus sp. oral taxon 190]